MYVLTPNEYNLDLHIPKKRKDWKIIFFHIWKRRIWVLYLRIIEFNFIISTNSVWQCQQMREKSLWSNTTTTSHGNRKCELNWLPFLKIESWDFFLPNTMLAAIFIKLKICVGWHTFAEHIFIFLLLVKLHLCPLLLLIYFALNSSMPGIDISFFQKKKKRVYLTAFSVFSFKESPNFETSRNNHTVEKQYESSQGGFCCIFKCYLKLMGKTMHFPCGEVYHKMGIWWKKSTHMLGGKMGTNCPWGNPCIHIL